MKRLFMCGVAMVSASVVHAQYKQSELPKMPPLAPERPQVENLPGANNTRNNGQLPQPGGNLGPPAWMKQGIRLTYRTQVATQSTVPNQQGGGGVGIVTVDISAIAGGRVAYDTRFYVGGNGNQPATNSAVYGTVAPVGNAGEYWKHPAELQQLVNNPPANHQIAAGAVEIGGRSVNAIVVKQGDANRDGQESSVYYDQQTGIALQILTKATGQGMTQSSYTILADTRERTLPWKTGRPPSWLGKVKRLTYTGGMSMQVQGGQQMPATPLTATLDVIETGANYLAVKQTVQFGNAMGGVQQQPVVSPCIVHGVSQLGSIYLPPMELRQLQQGQVLDEDKILGARVSVIGVGPTQYGRNVVTIAEESTGYASYYDYEIETGVMLAAAYQNKVLNQTIQIILTDLR